MTTIKEVHEKVKGNISDFVGYVPERDLRAMTINGLGCYNPETKVFGYSHHFQNLDDLGLFEKSTSLMSAKAHQILEGREPDAAHLLEEVLTHEYMHVLFDEKFQTKINRITVRHTMPLTRRMIKLCLEEGLNFWFMPPETRLSHGINEAFAYWAEDQIMQQRHLTQNALEIYESEMPGTGKSLLKFYSLFHQVAEQRGDQHVVKKLVSLVKKHLKKEVEPLTLPNLEVEMTQMPLEIREKYNKLKAIERARCQTIQPQELIQL